MKAINIQLDPYGMAKKLKEDPRLDDAVIHAIVTAVTESHEAIAVATNQGLDELEKQVATKSDIGELKGDIGELRGQIGELKGELKGQIGELKGDIGSLKGHLSMAIIAIVGVMVALQYLPVPTLP